MTKIASPREGLSAKRPFPPDCAARFRVERLLGQGGFGAVYLARQLELDRPAAVKVLLKETLRDTEQVARFLAEARLTAKVEHPNVVKIFDHGGECGIPWIAYEYIPGRSLRQILDTGGLGLGEAMRAAIQIAAALDAAHAMGVLHRDIKPDNVLEAEKGRYKVTDFGLAKLVGGGGIRTATGLVLGTPAYLAPELILGQPPSAASDIYALGILVYELITGAPPFQDENPLLIIERHLRSSPRQPSAIKSGSPEALDRIVQCALAKPPADRYATAKAFQQALETVAEQLHPGRNEVAPARGRKGVERTKIITVVPRESSPGPAKATSQIAVPPSPRRVSWALPVAGVALMVLIAALHRSVGHHTDGHLAPSAVAQPTPLASGATVTAPGRAIDLAGPSPTGGGGPMTMLRSVPGALTGGWSEFRSCEPALRAGAEAARRTLDWIHKRNPPIDLGLDPLIWANWISLDRWLDDPVGRWTPSGAVIGADLASSGKSERVTGDSAGFLGDLHERADAAAMANLREPPTQASIKDLTRLMGQTPEDGRYWLILGWILEKDGRPQVARRAYRAALELLGHTQFACQSSMAWSGLARALSVTPGRNLESEWLTYLAPGADRGEYWRGLRETTFLPGADTGIYPRLLQEAMKVPELGVDATLLLAESHIHYDWISPLDTQPDQALDIWNAGLNRYADPTRIVERLVRHYLERGNLEQARPLLARLESTSAWHETVSLLTHSSVDRGPTSSTLLEDRLAHENLRLFIFRLLESGLVQEAARQAESVQTDQWLDSSALAMELKLGAGGPEWVRKRYQQDLDISQFRPREWCQASGIFTTARDLKAMEEFLTAARRAFPREDFIGVVRALWLSRQGRHAQALAQLAACGPAGNETRQRPATLSEIVSRPIWMHACGVPGLEDAAATARRFELPDTAPLISTYWRCCVAGDLDGAARTALELFDRNPHDPQWSLVQLWDALRKKDRRRFDAWTMRARIVYRYQRVGLWPLREVDALQKLAGGW